MAGPSIVVRVLGDLKSLGAAFDGASKTASSAGSRIHGAFSSVLGTLNASGVLGPFGESLSAVDSALDNIAGHGKTIGTVMLGVGGALAGVGVGLQAIGSKDQAAHQQLQAAVEATGASYDDYKDRVEAAIKSQEKYGTTANQTQDALRSLTQATHDPAKALDLLNTATDVAAAKHEDLATAADQLGKVYNGNTKLLKPFGIELDKTTGKTADGKTAMQALAQVTAGQASAATDTFTGKLSAMRARVEDAAASFGQKYGPAITAVGAGLTGLGAVVETTTAVTKALAASETLSAIAEMGMLGPILLIIAAIAALGVAAYLIYRNWSTIWNGMKAAVEFVWLWIKQNWPLLLAIILGPIAVAALEIAKHWNDIKAGAGAVITWFRTVWSTVTGYITAPFVSAWQAIARGWDTVVGVVAGIPGQIGRVASGMWDSIGAAFRAMVNGIIDIWNGLHFTLPKINEGPIHIGGETIGVPRIPHLAQGGLITGTGLIYAHAGEAITPAADVGPRGPAVVVQQAVFNSGVDVDAFMRMAAWRVQTSRV